jgi:hypothetical protein
MMLCFFAAWPVNLYKAFKSRTAHGKSLIFNFIIELGYLAGMGSHLLSTSPVWYVVAMYAVNFIMVAIDICLYFRNRKLDKQAEARERILGM